MKVLKTGYQFECMKSRLSDVFGISFSKAKIITLAKLVTKRALVSGRSKSNADRIINLANIHNVPVQSVLKRNGDLLTIYPMTMNPDSNDCYAIDVAVDRVKNRILGGLHA